MNPDLDQILRDSYVEESQIINYGYCEGVWLPDDYLDVKNAIHNFQVRGDDIWVCGLPKTGTTWTQEMVWCLANDLNFQKATEKIDMRIPLLEGSHALKTRCLMRRLNKPLFGLSIEQIDQLPSPRFIKSHLPYHLLPKSLQESNGKTKIVYVVRNPKDTCISAFHFYRRTEGFCGGFEDFCELFLNDKISFTPYWEHVVGYYKHHGSDNILFLKYEDMKKDLASIVRKTAVFLNKSISDDEIHALLSHLSFENMRNNRAINYEKFSGNLEVTKLWDNDKRDGNFLRKGQVDQWKTDMSEEIIEKFDNWLHKKLDMYPELRGLLDY